MDNNNNKIQNQIQIEIPNEEAAGHYSNLAVISHGPNEFFIDHILMAPQTEKARVQSRIILTPENAKRLMLALQENIHKYEMTFGEISLRQPGAGNGPIPFPIPKGQA